MAATPYFSAEMVRALIHEERAWPRYETVYGELLVTATPGAWHQVIVGRLMVALSIYAAREGIGQVICSPADICWTPDVLVQPDLFVVPREQARTLDWAQMTTLLLAVEVMSPGTARADRFTKRRLYQDHRVALYWVVDPEESSAELWTPQEHLPRGAGEALVWHPEGASAPCTLPLEELFRPL